MKRRGFALPEIIAGTLLVTVAAAGSFSVFIVARLFADRFKHKTMATNRSAHIADRLRYRLSYDNPATDPLAVGSYDAATDPAGLLDVSGWQLNNEVNDLEAEYAVSNVWFNNGEEVAADPGTGTPAFKKVIIRVRWNERT